MRVYISGPISSSGTFLGNAAYAVEVYEHLLKMGYNPMCPQLTVFAFIGRHDQVAHSEWMRCDEAWIRSMDPREDAMLRLHGYSVGADMETNMADDMCMLTCRPPKVAPELVAEFFDQWYSRNFRKEM